MTATTITDAQIRDLIASGNLTATQITDCEHALQKRDRHWTRFQRSMQRGARIRCAAILSAHTSACPGRERAENQRLRR